MQTKESGWQDGSNSITIGILPPVYTNTPFSDWRQSFWKWMPWKWCMGGGSTTTSRTLRFVQTAVLSGIWMRTSVEQFRAPTVAQKWMVMGMSEIEKLIEKARGIEK